ncbi:MAG: hypothetical protein AAFP86_08665, partial [Planctomycetota bacterium]
ERAWTHERGSVSLSEAVVFTTGGQELAIPCDVEGDRMTMRVPAAFMNAAVGEIVIDPVIATDSLGSFGAESGWTTGAFDPNSDRYCLSRSLRYSNSDQDTVSFFVHATTAGITGIAFLEMADDRSSTAWMGCNAAGSSFVCTMLESFSANNSARVVTRVRDASTGTVGPTNLLQAPSSVRQPVHLSLGSDPYPYGATYSLLALQERVTHPVFGDRYEISTQLIDADGLPHGPRSIVASRSGFHFMEMTPTMGSPSTAQMEWALFYERAFSPGPLHGVSFNYDGTTRSGPNELSAEPIGLGRVASPTRRTSPGTGRPIVLVERYDALSEGGTMNTVMQVSDMEVVGEPYVVDESWRVVAEPLNRSHVLFATLADGWGVVTSDYRDRLAREIQPVSGGFGVTGAVESAGAGRPGFATSEYEWGGARMRRILTAGSLNVPPLDTPPIFVTLFDFPNGEAAGSMHCGGPLWYAYYNANLEALGDRSPLTPKTLRLSNLPENEVGYMLVGFGALSASTVEAQGICIGTGFDYLRGVFGTGTGGGYDLVLDPNALELNGAGTISAMSGQTQNFQFWYRRDANWLTSNAVSLTYL